MISMKLQKAFEMTVQYNGDVRPIKVNEQRMICLNDMVSYFPNKALDNWLTLKATKEFIVTIEKFLKPSNPTELKIEDFGNRGSIPKGLESIKAKRGKYDGGTYAHELLALEFATWLSPEFKLHVLMEFQNGTQRRENWNIKRILASHNYKIMSKAVEEDHDPAKHYHYSNEANMINRIIFGETRKGIRDEDWVTVEQMDSIVKLEGHNTTLIELGMDYHERKEKLQSLAILNRKRSELEAK